MRNNFDVSLKNALDAEFSWLDDFENPYNQYCFSSNFENNIKNIIPKAKNNYVSIGKHRVRKLFVAALVALLAIAITGCTFAIHYIIEWHETQNDVQDTLDITFDKQQNSQSGKNSDIILPEVPKGFKITGQQEDAFSISITYAGRDGEEIHFTGCNDLENMSVSIDNEYSDLEETVINGHKGYSYQKDNINIIYWTTDTYFCVLQGTCDYDILLSMAKSI